MQDKLERAEGCISNVLCPRTVGDFHKWSGWRLKNLSFQRIIFYPQHNSSYVLENTLHLICLMLRHLFSRGWTHRYVNSCEPDDTGPVTQVFAVQALQDFRIKETTTTRSNNFVRGACDKIVSVMSEVSSMNTVMLNCTLLRSKSEKDKDVS